MSELDSGKAEVDDADVDADDGMDDILKDPDFANMSDSDGDNLPLFGEKDSDDSDANDFEEEEEKEKKKQVDYFFNYQLCS